MIFVTAQPDELMFAWQTEVQMHNFTKLGIDLKQVYILVGTIAEVNENSTFEKWDRILKKYPEANIAFYQDQRESRSYIPSIRPFLLKKFFTDFEELQDEYMFYYDSDIALSDIPAFEAMQDGRWHISEASYISWNYIEEKKSPSLMKDMLSSVGIDEETVEEKQQKVGGVQYFIYGTTPEFWQKVEQDCERMHKVHHNSANFRNYRKEFFENKLKLEDKYANVSFDEWFAFDEYTKQHKKKPEGKEDWENWDFQVWCTDMWCIYWNALLSGADVYVNPELNFEWPSHPISNLEENKIYHDTGVSGDSTRWFHKGSYKIKTPWRDDLSKLGYREEDGQPGCQRFYLDLIEDIQQTEDYSDDINPADLPTVSCLMTTYGRFECVERSIACWLNQDYPNKELVILNTAPKPLELSPELQNKGIRIVNSEVIAGTNTKYTNVGQVRNDVTKLALGEYYICWDDDDFYMPFHISQGMKYILKTGKKAYMPEQSYFSMDSGNTLQFARNSMEAACIVKLDEIKKYGFKDSNGAEHLGWRTGLVDSGDLDEHNSVSPFESYLYLWGEEIASHKQSGSIGNPNCFEDHKAQSTDFGVRALSYYSPLRMKLWYEKLVSFNGSQELREVMKPYL